MFPAVIVWLCRLSYFALGTAAESPQRGTSEDLKRMARRRFIEPERPNELRRISCTKAPLMPYIHHFDAYEHRCVEQGKEEMRILVA